MYFLLIIESSSYIILLNLSEYQMRSVSTLNARTANNSRLFHILFSSPEEKPVRDAIAIISADTGLAFLLAQLTDKPRYNNNRVRDVPAVIYTASLSAFALNDHQRSWVVSRTWDETGSYFGKHRWRNMPTILRILYSRMKQYMSTEYRNSNFERKTSKLILNEALLIFIAHMHYVSLYFRLE